MELRHLRYFVTVASAGGFSGAATRLGVTQPALSRQVHDLERELGVALFERRGRRVRLTSEGEDLVARSRDILRSVERLGEQAQALRGGQAGRLRVGASPQVIQNTLAPFLARYLRSRPGIEVHLLEEGALRLPGLLERGDVDLALGILRSGDQLVGQPLHPVRMLALVASTHRLGRRATVDVSDLAGESVLLLRPGFWTREVFDGACRVAHVRPRIVLEAGEARSLVALADAGRGIAVIPSTALVRTRRLHAAPIVQGGTPLGTWLSVIWDPGRLLPVYARSFIDDLARHTRRGYPGREFERREPRLPRPEL